MALIDQVIDTFPANDDVGVPLRTTISITLDGVDYDTDSLKEGLFVEGPDTDQFVGPGQIDLRYPANVSQGEVDDFFSSPGRKGIASGIVDVTTSGGNTVVTFTSGLPLAASTIYTVTMGEILEADALTAYDGFITVSFTTGTGSIEIVPSTISTSPLQQSIVLPDILTVVSVSPLDRSVENDPSVHDIVITFDRDLDDTSIEADDITITIESVSDHPAVYQAPIKSVAKVITITNNLLQIRI